MPLLACATRSVGRDLGSRAIEAEGRASHRSRSRSRIDATGQRSRRRSGRGLRSFLHAAFEESDHLGEPDESLIWVRFVALTHRM